LSLSRTPCARKNKAAREPRRVCPTSDSIIPDVTLSQYKSSSRFDGAEGVGGVHRVTSRDIQFHSVGFSTTGSEKLHRTAELPCSGVGKGTIILFVLPRAATWRRARGVHFGTTPPRRRGVLWMGTVNPFLNIRYRLRRGHLK